jgi:hypothetical protein
VKLDLSTQRYLERSVVGSPSVDPPVILIKDSEENYPLPRAWMTKSATEKEYQVPPAPDQDLDAKHKPRTSIIALASSPSQTVET